MSLNHPAPFNLETTMRVAVKMKRSSFGSDEDIHGVNLGPKLYEGGQVYEVDESLAKNLIAEGSAELYVHEKKPEPPKVQEPEASKPKAKPAAKTKKNLGAAPENKGMK